MEKVKNEMGLFVLQFLRVSACFFSAFQSSINAVANQQRFSYYY